jgi:hypothetical protein
MIGDRRDGRDIFFDEGPAQKSLPIIGGQERQERQERHVFWSKVRLEKTYQSLADRRDGRDTFFGARSGSEICANHWRTGETGETRFLEKGPIWKPCQSLGTGETLETASGRKVRHRNPAYHWRQKRRERHVFWSKVRLEKTYQSLADRRDGRDTFLKQGPAQKSLPIIGGHERRERHVFWSKVRLRNLGQSLADRRVGRDTFLEKGPIWKPCQSLGTGETLETASGRKVRHRNPAYHWRQERREIHVFGQALMLWKSHDAYYIRGQT